MDKAEKLTLSIPGYGQMDNSPMNTATFTGSQGTLAKSISVFAEVAFLAGAFLMFFWAAWGVFDYIRAEGNKDGLAKARKKIQWAIVGFVILILAFFISDFIQSTILPSQPVRDLKPLSF